MSGWRNIRYVLMAHESDYPLIRLVKTIKHYISFHILKCEPWGLPYTSVLSTIHLYPITSGSAAGSTFVEWSGHYSADASAGKLPLNNTRRPKYLLASRSCP